MQNSIVVDGVIYYREPPANKETIAIDKWEYIIAEIAQYKKKKRSTCMTICEKMG